MHLASEVSSTTNSGQESNSKSGNSNSATNNNNNNSSSNNNNLPLTAETLAERTIDGLLAEHPGELVKTGCPHVVNFKFYFSNFLYSSRYFKASINSSFTSYF